MLPLSLLGGAMHNQYMHYDGTNSGITGATRLTGPMVCMIIRMVVSLLIDTVPALHSTNTNTKVLINLRQLRLHPIDLCRVLCKGCMIAQLLAMSLRQPISALTSALAAWCCFYQSTRHWQHRNDLTAVHATCMNANESLAYVS